MPESSFGLIATALSNAVMGTSGARNPTLTAQALAWRTADRLVHEWKAIAR